MKEIWKQIPIAKNYEASSLGRIRSLKDNFGNFRKQPLVLKLLNPPSMRYSRINLHIDGRQHSCAVHRIILWTFKGPSPKGYHGAHLNGDAKDNRIANLVWTTPRENNEHKKKHGTWQCGERHGNCKYQESVIREAKSLLKQGINRREVMRRLDLPLHLVKDLKGGRAWKHVE